MNLITIFLTHQFQGGALMWIIFFTGIVASYIGLEKVLFLNRITKCRNRFTANIKNMFEGNTKLEKIDIEEYQTLQSQLEQCICQKKGGYKGFCREFLISAVPTIESHLSTMNAWVSVAPLLGLLGTVMGMVQTFKVIMDFGVGNPALTAEGISITLLTTQAGLTVAFPVMLFHNYLINRKNALISIILKDFEEISHKYLPVSIQE